MPNHLHSWSYVTHCITHFQQFQSITAFRAFRQRNVCDSPHPFSFAVSAIKITRNSRASIASDTQLLLSTNSSAQQCKYRFIEKFEESSILCEVAVNFYKGELEILMNIYGVYYWLEPNPGGQLCQFFTTQMKKFCRNEIQQPLQNVVQGRPSLTFDESSHAGFRYLSVVFYEAKIVTLLQSYMAQLHTAIGTSSQSCQIVTVFYNNGIEIAFSTIETRHLFPMQT